jgi:sulfite reductase beta subunit-like hemoprotein
MRISLILCGLACVQGCAAYTATKISLLGAAREGVDRVDRRLADDAARADARFDVESTRLGEAFDADVDARADQQTLEPQWVIEHRRAYAIGLAALDERRRYERAAAETSQGDLRATRRALDELERLTRAEARILNPRGYRHESPD